MSGRIKKMSKDWIYKNLLIVYMVLFSVVVECIGLFIVKNKWSFTIGIAFGLIFSLLKLMLMKNSIKKSLYMNEGKAQTYANVQYLIRYILTGIVLVVAALEPTISLLGVFIGLMSMKVGAYMQYFYSPKLSSKGN